MSQQSSPPRRQTPPPPQYVEVNCRSSGKIRRFAVGTGAGFAVGLINRKLKGTVVAASHIEAVKDGKEEEEPIAFGPTSLLSNFGEGWKLQTATLTDLSSEVGNGQFQQTAMQKPGLGGCIEDVNLWEQLWIPALEAFLSECKLGIIPKVELFPDGRYEIV